MAFSSRLSLFLKKRRAGKRQFNLAGFHKCFSGCFVTPGMQIWFEPTQYSSQRSTPELVSFISINFAKVVAYPLRLHLFVQKLWVRFFGRIQKRIFDPRSYGFFATNKTKNPKKGYFIMTR